MVLLRRRIFMHLWAELLLAEERLALSRLGFGWYGKVRFMRKSPSLLSAGLQGRIVLWWCSADSVDLSDEARFAEENLH